MACAVHCTIEVARDSELTINDSKDPVQIARFYGFISIPIVVSNGNALA